MEIYRLKHLNRPRCSPVRWRFAQLRHHQVARICQTDAETQRCFSGFSADTQTQTHKLKTCPPRCHINLQRTRSDLVSLSANMENLTLKDSKPEEEEEAKETFVAFARVYSGVVRKGQRVFVLGPKYDPAQSLSTVSPPLACCSLCSRDVGPSRPAAVAASIPPSLQFCVRALPPSTADVMQADR